MANTVSIQFLDEVNKLIESVSLDLGDGLSPQVLRHRLMQFLQDNPMAPKLSRDELHFVIAALVVEAACLHEQLFWPAKEVDHGASHCPTTL